MYIVIFQTNKEIRTKSFQTKVPVHENKHVKLFIVPIKMTSYNTNDQR